MKLDVVNLVFESDSYEEVMGFFKKIDAIGYIANNDKSWNAVVINNSRILLEIDNQKVIIKNLEKRKISHIKTGIFNGLKFLKSKPTRDIEKKIHIDKITSNGFIQGWGIKKDINRCEVKLWVDGDLIDRFPIDRFRPDLLKEGIGSGCHAFSHRISESVLDGKEHKVVVELIELGDLKEIVLAKDERYIKLPFHFNLSRLWIGSGKDHSYEWTKKNEADYLDIRSEILKGTNPKSIKMAADFIDSFPHAIFLDFGIKDKCLIENEFFQGFRFRLRNRWGIHFGPDFCNRGDLCCKKLSLPYNSKLIANRKNINPIDFDSPWEQGGVLDCCPIPIRHFASKKLTVDFAHSINVKVPETLGRIKSLKDFESFNFPNRYVLKPDFASGVELYLMSGNLNLFDALYYKKDDIKRRVCNFLEGGEGREYIVEEFLLQENVEHDAPIIPLDYKFHCFGGKARIIHVDDRNTLSRDPLRRKQSWLSRDWSHAPVPFRNSGEHPNESIKRPDCFKEMLYIADSIAAKLNDYIRIDLYATPDGPVLGEITSYSHSGQGFSEYGDMILGQAWEIFN